MKRLSNYRKLYAVIIGTAALVAAQKFNIQIPGLEQIYTQLLLAAITSWGVYQVPNDQG